MSALLLLLSVAYFTAAVQGQQQDSLDLPLQPSTASLQLMTQEGTICPTDAEFQDAHDAIVNTVQSLLPQIVLTIPCTSSNTGLLSHCAAESCTGVFESLGNAAPSNYYWLTLSDGTSIQVYCNADTMEEEYSSCDQAFALQRGSDVYYIRPPDSDVSIPVYCNQDTLESEYLSCQGLFQLDQDATTGPHSIRLPNGAHTTVYCNAETLTHEYISCSIAYLVEPDLPSGDYNIRPAGDDTVVSVYCDMGKEECGGGGWTRVATYDFGNPSTVCPGDWESVNMSNVRACGRMNHQGCDSALFSASHPYSKVCGRVIAYHRGTPEGPIVANRNLPDTTIDTDYVDGVIISHGMPREHVWTFAATGADTHADLNAVCPCNNVLDTNIPDFAATLGFVGENYFCDTGVTDYAIASANTEIIFPEDPLWDGQGCAEFSSCCTDRSPPWFDATVTGAATTIDDQIEVRICANELPTQGDTPIAMLDLFVQ